jgi:hypothetical protein
MRYYVVVNPICGRGLGEKSISAIKECMWPVRNQDVQSEK